MSKKTREEAVAAEKSQFDEVLVMTSDPGAAGVRGGGLQSFKVEELSVNINLFIQQMGKVLGSTPDTLGKFHFDEFEIHAEISADGTIAVLGSGVHTGINGGLKFVFRRSTSGD